MQLDSVSIDRRHFGLPNFMLGDFNLKPSLIPHALTGITKHER